MALFFALNFSAAANDINIFKLENKIEELVVDIVKPHIPEDKYVVIVTIEDDSETGSEEGSNLPYSSLQIKSKALQRAIDFNSPNKIFEVDVAIELLIDESLFEEKEKFLTDKITQELKIDGEKRTFKATSAKLVEEPIIEDANESLQIEMERTKLEALKTEEELKKKLADQEEAAKKAAEAKQPTIIEYLEQFQLVILALLLVFGMIILAFLGSGSLKKGAGSISEALKAVGESLAASKDSGGADAGGDESDIGADKDAESTVGEGEPQPSGPSDAEANKRVFSQSRGRENRGPFKGRKL